MVNRVFCTNSIVTKEKRSKQSNKVFCNDQLAKEIRSSTELEEVLGNGKSNEKSLSYT